MLKQVGNFQEIRHGDRQGPSLRECIASTPQPYEKQIIHYLQNGLILAACAGPATDVLSPIKKLIDAPHVFTDGAWQWYGDLAYYVREYHCRIPDEFLQHMQARNWLPPQQSEINLP